VACPIKSGDRLNQGTSRWSRDATTASAMESDAVSAGDSLPESVPMDYSMLDDHCSKNVALHQAGRQIDFSRKTREMT